MLLSSPDRIISRDSCCDLRVYIKACVYVLMHTLHWWYALGIKSLIPSFSLDGQDLEQQGCHFCPAEMRTSSTHERHFSRRLLVRYINMVLNPNPSYSRWGCSLGLLDWAVGIIKTKAICHFTDFFPSGIDKTANWSSLNNNTHLAFHTFGFCDWISGACVIIEY